MKGTKSKSINRLASALLLTSGQRPIEATSGGSGFNGQYNRFPVNVIRGRAGPGGKGEAAPTHQRLDCTRMQEAISERA